MTLADEVEENSLIFVTYLKELQMLFVATVNTYKTYISNLHFDIIIIQLIFT